MHASDEPGIPISDRRIQTVCLMVLACVAGIYLVYWLRPVLVPFVVACFIVSGIAPLLTWTENRFGVSRLVAAGMTFLFGVALMGIFGLTVWISIIDLTANASIYERRVRQLVSNFEKRLPLEWISAHGLMAPLKPKRPEIVEDYPETTLEPAATIPTSDSRGESAGEAGRPAEDAESDSTEKPTAESDTDSSEDAPSQTDRRGPGNEPSAAENRLPVRSGSSASLPAQEGERSVIPDLSDGFVPPPSIGFPDSGPDGGTGNGLESGPDWQYIEEPSDGSKLIQSFVRDGISVVSQAFVSLVSTAVVVLIYVFFLLLGNPNYAKTETMQEIDSQIRGYLSLKTVISIGTGAVFGLTLRLFGVPMALSFGVLAFLLNFIPNVGPIVASLLPIPLILLDPSGNIWWMIAVIATTSSVQLLSGNVVEPKLMGNSSDLHPVTILLALMFWGMMWGIIGMFLATPITAAIKIVMQRFEPTHSLANIMAGRWELGSSTDPDEPGVSQA